MSEQPSIDAVIPLESNPEIFTEFASKLGLSPLLNFTDIYSLDDPDLISFIPRPIHAIILLFPITEKYEQFKDSEPVENIDNSQIVWLKQVVKNACGLHALLHSLLNIPRGLIVQSSPVDKFRSEILQNNSDPVKLVQNIAKDMYTSFGEQGQTEAPAAEDNIDLHFVCFVKKGDTIYELDGRRNGPVKLNENCDVNSDLLADDTISKRVKQYISLVDDDNALKFALMGLTPSMD